jgi:GNAT superfamily N-acetyltransferase
MWWRLARAEFEQKKGRGNRLALHGIVNSGPPPGVLGYLGSEPVGWCAVAPRADYARLTNSRVLGPVDDEPVWSVVCFFVARQNRRKGVTEALLRAAVRFAGEHGARFVEGYPIEPIKDRIPDVFGYTGFTSTFAKAGFTEVLRRSPTRPIMRCPT